MYRFEATAWEWDGEAAWVFVTLPHEVADAIEESASPRSGFGSVPVDVTVGASHWSTSLFPDKAAASYVLPLKRARANTGSRPFNPLQVRGQISM